MQSSTTARAMNLLTMSRALGVSRDRSLIPFNTKSKPMRERER